jgi:hypothetical protein
MGMGSVVKLMICTSLSFKFERSRHIAKKMEKMALCAISRTQQQRCVRMVETLVRGSLTCPEVSADRQYSLWYYCQHTKGDDGETVLETATVGLGGLRPAMFKVSDLELY